jgi:UrcA family protein
LEIAVMKISCNTFCGAVAAAALLASAPGFAQQSDASAQQASATTDATPPSGSVSSLHVSYRELDLTTEQGNQVFSRRLASAASVVCAVVIEPPLNARRMIRACERSAIAGAVKQLADSRIAALVAKRALRELGLSQEPGRELADRAQPGLAANQSSGN